MFKKKTLVAGLVALLAFGARADVLESRLSYVAESEIPHAIGVYITPMGQNKIFRNVDKILEGNGLSVNEAYFHHQHFEMEEQPLEKMLPKEGALREAALKIKETLQRFLMGLRFNDHKFSIDLEEIDLNIDWQDLRIELDPIAKMTGKLKFKLILEAKGINLNVGKFRAQDLNNDILGSVGIDDFSLFLAEDSVPLRFEIPVSIVNNRQRGPKVEVGQVFSNILDTFLDGEMRGPVLLPQIEIHINGRVITANYDEIEEMLKSNNDRIVSAVKDSLHGWVNDDAAKLFNEEIAKQTSEGLFKEVNVMSPAGAPDDQIVAPFQWGIKFKEYDFVGDSIHLTLDGYAKDGIVGPLAMEQAHLATRLPLAHRIAQNHDFVLSVNEGFINRIVQLSYARGYFNDFTTAKGEKYKIAKVPVFKLKNSGTDSPARLSVELEYTVTGVGAALVRNPIRINFDMKLDFPVENGKTKIIATEIDMDSVHVDKKYIRNFLGIASWSGVVMPRVRNEFKEAQNDVRGMVLADDFPLPDTMAGIPLYIKGTKVDPNGHLMIHIDTDFDE